MTTGACCERMAAQLAFSCDRHADPHDCPDALVGYSEKTGQYGIYVHDGGVSWVTISYCPWCGARLDAQNGPDRGADDDGR